MTEEIMQKHIIANNIANHLISQIDDVIVNRKLSYTDRMEIMTKRDNLLIENIMLARMDKITLEDLIDLFISLNKGVHIRITDIDDYSETVLTKH